MESQGKQSHFKLLRLAVSMSCRMSLHRIYFIVANPTETTGSNRSVENIK